MSGSYYLIKCMYTCLIRPDNGDTEIKVVPLRNVRFNFVWFCIMLVQHLYRERTVKIMGFGIQVGGYEKIT